MSSDVQPTDLASRVADLEAALAVLQREKGYSPVSGNSAPKAAGPNFRDLADVSPYSAEGYIPRYRKATGLWTPEDATTVKVPACRSFQSASQTINPNTFTPLVFTAPEKDNFGFWTSGVPTRFTVPIAGWYLAAGEFQSLSAVANISYYARFYLNGSTYLVEHGFYHSVASQPARRPLSTIMFCQAGDYFELDVDHTHTAALGMYGYVYVARLGALDYP